MNDQSKPAADNQSLPESSTPTLQEPISLRKAYLSDEFELLLAQTQAKLEAIGKEAPSKLMAMRQSGGWSIMEVKPADFKNPQPPAAPKSRLFR